MLKTDASAQAISAVLSQFHDSDNERRLHPVAYYSRTMKAAEKNYGVGDSKLLAIFEALKEYGPMILNLVSTLTVLTDHSNLTTFQTKKSSIDVKPVGPWN